MRVPVLCYHANNVAGREYANNDHIALAEDLALLRRRGRVVVSLSAVIDALEGHLELPEGAVALSCDDGSRLDWDTVEHPEHGPQRGFAEILREHGAVGGMVPSMTAFVIVSPRARRMLERTCLGGHPWWRDDWWPIARAVGPIAIESHGWDHNHDTLEHTAFGGVGRARGFATLDDARIAEAEITQASRWLDAWCGGRTRLFAYPYGEIPEFLANEWFPREAGRVGLRAAFGTAPAPVTRGADRWRLPRYVCGSHWCDPGELERLLEA